MKKFLILLFSLIIAIAISACKDQGNNNMLKARSSSSPTNKASSEPVGQSTDQSSKGSNQQILTVNNNKDLATLLAVKDPSDPIVSEFAKKYANKSIEFDGNIADMTPHGSYTTRFDFLICAGDYSKTAAIGPQFKYEDVSVPNLHLIGSRIPENISKGLNFHFTAKVKEYNETQQLFFLEPISTEIR